MQIPDEGGVVDAPSAAPGRPGVNPRFDFSRPLPDISGVKRAHFIAIGGSGMSGVAALFAQRGIAVSGSDAIDVPVLESFRAAGMAISVGYAARTAADLPADTVVVVSSAIGEDNQELRAARAAGLPVLHRSQGLRMLTADRQCLAVAGANGKTTTSGMAVRALEALRADPSAAIGAPIVGLGQNFRVGAGPDFVVEADESDGSFVVYRPQIAVVTNIRPDHLDFYGSVEILQQAYANFADSIVDGGLLVVCADDPQAALLGERQRRSGRRVKSYGWADSAQVRAIACESDGRVSVVRAEVRGVEAQAVPVQMRVQVPGEHNVLNALGVLTALVFGRGFAPQMAADALQSFAGTARRFQVQGEVAGVTVVDDYAHNPDKVAALVATAQSWCAGRVHVIFQPHLFSRTLHGKDAFARALQGADSVSVMDIFAAREEPVPGVTGEIIVTAMREIGAGAETAYTPDAAAALRRVVSLAQPGDAVFTVGAGDVTHLGPQILTALQRQ